MAVEVDLLKVVAALAVFNFALSTASTTPSPSSCKDEIPFPDPDDCTRYYQCFYLNSQWYPVHQLCNPGGYWDNDSKSCNEGTCTNPTSTTTEDASTTLVESSTTSSPEDSSTTSTSATSDDSSTTNGSTSADDSSSTSSSTSTDSSSTSDETSASPTTPPSFICTTPGFFAHPTDVTKYYQCVLIGGQYYYYVYTCPATSCFNQATGNCVVCSATNTTTTTTTAPPATTTTTTTTAATTSAVITPGPPTFVCTSTGFFAHPTDPTKYYRCVLIGAQFYYYVYTCPQSSCYQQSTGYCVVGACASNTTTATPATTATIPSNSTSAPTTVTTPSTTTTIPTTTLPTEQHPCPYEGYFADNSNCNAYYRCVIVNGQMYRYMFSCPSGSYWNNSAHGCLVGACPTT